MYLSGVCVSQCVCRPLDSCYHRYHHPLRLLPNFFFFCLFGICRAGRNNKKIHILETLGWKKRKINVKLCRIDLLTYIFRLCFTLIDSSLCCSFLLLFDFVCCCGAGKTFFFLCFTLLFSPSLRSPAPVSWGSAAPITRPQKPVQIFSFHLCVFFFFVSPRFEFNSICTASKYP